MDESPNLPDSVVIPDHQLVRRIGKGGYGEIWLARNVMGTFRAVKIVFRSTFKDIKPYAREFKGIEKFEPLSRSHPGVVNVLQIGLNNDAGYFYYVMELADDEVEGSYFDPDNYSARTLGKELAARGRLPARESLHIGIHLASALSHLHEAGLVHRDIKPSNIIFVNGKPKLADIGLVVALADAQTFVGTEGYIPPEGPGSIAADIYSLGKVLYEMSTGQGRDSFPELPNELSTFPDRETVVELNEVVVKACANAPQARHRSAEELRTDLEMLFEGRSVKRLRFVERQLAWVTRVAAAALFFAVVASVFAYAINRIRNREKQLLATQYVVGGAVRLEQRNLHASLPLFAEALRLQQHDREAAEANRVRVGSALEQSPHLLQSWEQEHNVTDIHFSSDGGRMLVSGNKTTRILDVSTGATNHEFIMENNIETAAFSPDDRRVAVSSGVQVTLFEASSGAEIFERKYHGHVYSAEFSPDGRALVLACGKGCAHVIDANTGDDERELIGHGKTVVYASFSPDGTMIVTASYDGTARLWDAKTCEVIASLPQGQWVYDAAFSPDNKRVVTASSDHTLNLWAVGPHPQLLARMEHNGTVRRARFSPDGRWIVSAGWDHTVRFWNGHNGQAANSLINMQMPVMHATFSPEGRRVAVGGKSGNVRIWDVQPSAPFNPGMGIVSANGERYVTYVSNSLHVWNARDDSPATSSIKVSSPIASLSCSTDGRTIVALCQGTRESGSVVEVHTAGSLMLRSFPLQRVIRKAVLSPDASKLLTSSSGLVWIWNVATGELLFGPKKYEGGITEATFSPDSREVAFGNGTNLYILDAQTGLERFPSFSPGMNIRSISFSDDSLKLIVAGARPGLNPGAALVFDAHTGKILTQTALHTDGIGAACFAHNTKVAATGGEDSFVAVWDADTGQSRYERMPLSWQITSVAFSSDDRWLLATSWYEMKLWETRTGHPLTAAYSAPGVFDAGGFCAGNSRVWARTSRGLFFWDLPRSKSNPDEILALAHYLGVTIPTGLRWDASAFPISKLREQSAANAARTQATMESWHRQQAEFFGKEGDSFAARFHRTQLEKYGPNAATNTAAGSPSL